MSSSCIHIEASLCGDSKHETLFLDFYFDRDHHVSIYIFDQKEPERPLRQSATVGHPFSLFEKKIGGRLLPLCFLLR